MSKAPYNYFEERNVAIRRAALLLHISVASLVDEADHPRFRCQGFPQIPQEMLEKYLKHDTARFFTILTC